MIEWVGSCQATESGPGPDNYRFSKIIQLLSPIRPEFGFILKNFLKHDPPMVSHIPVCVKE
jgi:hypothetical protein